MQPNKAADGSGTSFPKSSLRTFCLSKQSLRAALAVMAATRAASSACSKELFPQHSLLLPERPAGSLLSFCREGRRDGDP